MLSGHHPTSATFRAWPETKFGADLISEVSINLDISLCILALKQERIHVKDSNQENHPLNRAYANVISS